MAVTTPDALAQTLVGLCTLYLRTPDGFATDATTGAPVLTFTPPLTTAEQASLNDLLTMAHFGIDNDITLTEWQAVKPDAANLKTYLGLASPTNAQSVAAIKSIIRVLGALLRS